MSAYITEEEQLKQIREWVSKYGNTIIISIAIALGGSMIWRYWQGHQENTSARASASYEQMIISLMGDDQMKTKLQAEYVIKNYPKTPYAAYASFILAKQEVNNNNLPDAEKNLQWVIDNTKDNDLRQIAILRKARFLNAENKSKEALELLEEIHDKTYLIAAFAIKGDIYSALGNKAAARVAYNAALNALPNSDSTRQFIQMKLSELSALDSAAHSSAGDNA